MGGTVTAPCYSAGSRCAWFVLVTVCSSLSACEKFKHQDVCDGTDNDGNGQIDDPFPVGERCVLPNGETGHWRCVGPQQVNCEGPRDGGSMSEEAGSTASGQRDTSIEAGASDAEVAAPERTVPWSFDASAPPGRGEETTREGVDAAAPEDTSHPSVEPPDASVIVDGGVNHDTHDDSAETPSLQDAIADLEAAPSDGNECREDVVRFRNPPIMAQSAPGDGGLGDRCASTTCDIAVDGSLLMTFCLECQSERSPWALCDFATYAWDEFDSYHGADGGELEVEFCVEGPPVAGTINLWYGHDPERRRLPLIRDGVELSQGCYVRYFSSEQVQSPPWDSLSEECRNVCGGANAETCGTLFPRREDAGVEREGLDAGADRGWVAPLTVAAENCTGRNQGRLRILSVRRLSGDCSCASDDHCGDQRPICHRASLTPECPRDRSSGVCGPIGFGPDQP